MKLADLGMSRAVYGSQEYVQRSADAVPLRWMSPEAAAELRFTHKRCVCVCVCLWKVSRWKYVWLRVCVSARVCSFVIHSYERGSLNLQSARYLWTRVCVCVGGESVMGEGM